jgi:ADP-ribosyltransferase exoenzyme
MTHCPSCNVEVRENAIVCLNCNQTLLNVGSLGKVLNLTPLEKIEVPVKKEEVTVEEAPKHEKTKQIFETDDLTSLIEKARHILLPEEKGGTKLEEKNKLCSKLKGDEKQVQNAYRLFVYLIENTHLKWDDFKGKKPFKDLGWKCSKIYEHYRDHENKSIEHEDGGLDAYYGPFYKILNPFLRYLDMEFKDSAGEILDGKIDIKVMGKLIEKLNQIKDENKFAADADENYVRQVLSYLKGARREIEKKSIITPVKLTHVFRGDGERTTERLAKACGFSKDDLDRTGEVLVNKKYTQVGFTSTSESEQIGPPASTGTIWNIKLEKGALCTEGGLYTAEKEVLFPPNTDFIIEKVTTVACSVGALVKGDKNTKYVVFARQGG